MPVIHNLALKANVADPEFTGGLSVGPTHPIIQPLPTQRRTYIENSDGLGSGATPFFTPEQQPEIIGTRTSDTVFTRATGTWVADALVGQFAFSYATGAGNSGVWLPITANTTTTFTVSGVLHATGTACLTCPWNPIYASYAHGQGGAAFTGGVFDGQSIWLVPYSSSNIIKINPATGGLTTYAHGQGGAAFIGGVFDGQSIWLVPHDSSNIVKINPATGGLTTYAHGQGGAAFYGGVFDGQSIWLVPHGSSNIIKINPPGSGIKSALISAATTISHASPSSADYAIASVQLAGYGFSTEDEGNTVLSVIKNIQDRLAEIETRLMR